MTGREILLLILGWIFCAAAAAILLGGFLAIGRLAVGWVLDLGGYVAPPFGRWLDARREWRWFWAEYGQELAELARLGTGGKPGGRHHTDAGGPAW